jgi:hypothetical protein
VAPPRSAEEIERTRAALRARIQRFEEEAARARAELEALEAEEGAIIDGDALAGEGQG